MQCRWLTPVDQVFDDALASYAIARSSLLGCRCISCCHRVGSKLRKRSFRRGVSSIRVCVLYPFDEWALRRSLDAIQVGLIDSCIRDDEPAPFGRTFLVRTMSVSRSTLFHSYAGINSSTAQTCW
jgi:hypothetical protein